jgi:hypothetical protein
VLDHIFGLDYIIMTSGLNTSLNSFFLLFLVIKYLLSIRNIFLCIFYRSVSNKVLHKY